MNDKAERLGAISHSNCRGFFFSSSCWHISHQHTAAVHQIHIPLLSILHNFLQLLFKGWLIRLWPEVEGDELHSFRYVFVQFISLSYCAKSFKLRICLFLFRLIENCKSALSQKMDSIDLHAVVQEYDVLHHSHKRQKRWSVATILIMMMTSLLLWMNFHGPKMLNSVKKKKKSTAQSL